MNLWTDKQIIDKHQHNNTALATKHTLARTSVRAGKSSIFDIENYTLVPDLPLMSR
jgi:hypothetical protein